MAEYGDDPTAYLTLEADVALVITFNVGANGTTFSTVQKTFNYTPTSPIASQTFTVPYPDVEFGQWDIENEGVTNATVTNINTGLEAS